MRTMRKLTFALAILLIAGIMPFPPALADEKGVTYYIRELQAYGWRVKLRDGPSQSSDVLGQYFAGTDVMVYNMSGGRARVEIGGRKGYMMSEFLVPSGGGKGQGPVIGYVRYPDGDGRIGLWDDDGREIARVPQGVVTVLGTVDEMTLHIAVESGSGCTYGYASSEKITETDNMASAVTDAGAADALINVREAPSRDAAVKAKLYPGARVYRLFDDHAADDGWERVRVGSLTGYIMNEFLDYSSAGAQRYQPATAQLAAPSAIVTGCTTRGSVSRGDPLWVLGTAGSTRTPLYFCLAGYRAQDNPDTYAYDTCYIMQDRIVARPAGSASTSASLKAGTPLYRQDENGDLAPFELTVYDNASGTVSGTISILPPGTKLSVYYGTVKPGEDTVFYGYVMPGAGWLYVEAEYAPYQSAAGFIPVSCAAYDTGLDIPGEWTGQ